jgi:hypothetical protein
MAQSKTKVLLDLNNPEFQRSWIELERDDAERVRSTFKKLIQLTWSEVYRDKGLRWEKIQSVPPPLGVDALYSFRLSQSARGVGYRDGDFLRVLLVTSDHDTAYSKR